MQASDLTWLVALSRLRQPLVIGMLTAIRKGIWNRCLADGISSSLDQVHAKSRPSPPISNHIIITYLWNISCIRRRPLHFSMTSHCSILLFTCHICRRGTRPSQGMRLRSRTCLRLPSGERARARRSGGAGRARRGCARGASCSGGSSPGPASRAPGARASPSTGRPARRRHRRRPAGARGSGCWCGRRVRSRGGGGTGGGTFCWVVRVRCNVWFSRIGRNGNGSGSEECLRCRYLNHLVPCRNRGTMHESEASPI